MPVSDGELRLIAVQDLHQYWPFIKDGLEQVRKHSAEDWIAEDVYTAIRTGGSTLHVAFVGGAYAGFCVLTALQGYSSKSLHIWCAYGVPGMSVVERFEKELVAIALRAGARRITFFSPRTGWEKRLKDYVPKQMMFEKELICQAADHPT